jgi:membrane protein implicated in regulation of membrane protease activity
MTSPADARSALNLRLVLALGGAAMCLVLGLLALAALPAWVGVVLLLLAVVGVVDALVLQRRRAARREAHRKAGHGHDSLFE